MWFDNINKSYHRLIKRLLHCRTDCVKIWIWMIFLSEDVTYLEVFLTKRRVHAVVFFYFLYVLCSTHRFLSSLNFIETKHPATYPKVSGYPELPWYFILHTYFEKIILNSTCFYDKNTVFFVSSTQWDVFLHFSIFDVKIFFFTFASRIIQHPEIICAVACVRIFNNENFFWIYSSI